MSRQQREMSVLLLPEVRKHPFDVLLRFTRTTFPFTIKNYEKLSLLRITTTLLASELRVNILETEEVS